MSMPLADELRAWTDERLAELLRLRPDLMTPVPPDISTLASRCAYYPSVSSALQDLALPQFRTVEVLCLLPEPATAAQVSANVDGADVSPALEELRRRALVWGADDELRVVPTVRQILGAPAGLGRPLSDLLAMRPAAAVAILAGNLASCGLPIDPSATKADLVTGLAGLFAIPDTRVLLLTQVSPGAREMLDRLSGGSPYGSVEDAFRVVSMAEATTPVEELLSRGLLLPVDPDTVTVPREVGVHLRGGTFYADFPAEPPALPAGSVNTRDAHSADRAGAASAFTTVRRTEELLETWGLEPAAALRAGGLGVRELRRAATLLEVDEPAATLLVETAYAAGLLGQPTTEDVWTPSIAYDGWRQQEAAVRWSRLASAWLRTERAPGAVGTREDRSKSYAPLGPDLFHPVAAELRLATLELLASVPAGSAPSADEVTAHVHWHRPLLPVEMVADVVRWTLRESEELGVTGRGALTSYARPLIAAAGEPAGPARLRTPSAAPSAAESAAAEKLEPLLPEPLDHVLLQADLTAVAPGPLTAELSATLALAADVESRGGATVYRFGETSIRRALDAGRSAADLHAFLQQHSRTPVPQTLSYLVDDVARRHGRLRVGSAPSYLRCDDEHLLAELLVAKRAADLGLRRLAPTVLLSSAPPEVLLERLRALGYSPMPEGPSGELVVRRPDARRAPTPPALPAYSRPPAPPAELLDKAMRALRAGDRARLAVRGGSGSSAKAADLPRLSNAETLQLLRSAVPEGTPLWISYVNAEGSATVRLVEPMSLSGGYLRAYDHLRDEMRTFTVHRITGAAPAEG